MLSGDSKFILQMSKFHTNIFLIQTSSNYIHISGSQQLAIIIEKTNLAKGNNDCLLCIEKKKHV